MAPLAASFIPTQGMTVSIRVTITQKAAGDRETAFSAAV
jgi:hypothetical protein